MHKLNNNAKQPFFPPAADLGFGVVAALANNLLAVLCSLTWFAVPHGVSSNPAGTLLFVCMMLGWACALVDLFRRHTYRYWARVVLVPIGMLLNFLPFFVYSGLANLITSRLGNGPA